MKDTKSLTLLLLSSVLFLLSIILLCTWGYQYYHQIQEDKSKGQLTVKQTSEVSDATRDSLLKIYKLTLNSLDTKADTVYSLADSLNGQLNLNLQEFYRLRDEIAGLLQSQTPKTEDLLLAKKKITELQTKVEQLKYRNTDVESENKKLRAVIAQLSKQNSSSQTGAVNAVQAFTDNTAPVPVRQTSAVPGSISAANVVLTAVSGNESNPSITSAANVAEKLVGTFTIKNNSTNTNFCDLVVVVTNPSGQVIQKSAWESGTFETSSGKRIYSVKIRCEAGKGESKQLNFSLSPDNYPKGNYTMLIYHEGKVIARATRALS
jgi:predicted RNase H-like nuclease (RuvC/YqgF family)